MQKLAKQVTETLPRTRGRDPPPLEGLRGHWRRGRTDGGDMNPSHRLFSCLVRSGRSLSVSLIYSNLDRQRKYCAFHTSLLWNGQAHACFPYLSILHDVAVHCCCMHTRKKCPKSLMAQALCARLISAVFLVGGCSTIPLFYFWDEIDSQ
jgi:hypothetical protein